MKPIPYIDDVAADFPELKIVCAHISWPWEDEMLADTLAMHGVLQDKGVPAWIDIWGFDVNHDWPWWRKMAPYFLSKIL